MSDEKKASTPPRDSGVFLMVRKNEGNAIGTNATEAEDKFSEFYLTADGQTGGANIIKPTWDLASLREACRENSSLSPCVSAMEVNIDGTGYFFVDASGEAVEDDADEAKEYVEFTNDIYPQTTFLSLRRILRRDIEETGNGYIEVLRNQLGEIIFSRRVAPEDMRLCRLSAPIEKDVTVNRNGNDTVVKVCVRERRFAQIVNKAPVYFAEFGASRKLDKKSGLWEGEEAQGSGESTAFDINNQATEIIHFTLDKDSTTPYGLPRWISAHRSVRGQIEAEDLNIAFFDAGGVPPVLVTVTGGELTPNAREALRMIFQGKAKQKLEGAVIEAESTSGTLDKEGKVSLDIHQFGDKNDSMFQKYDENCEYKVRKSFRLPKLFLGDVDGVNFATAYTMYMVTEAQVFEPERTEFDSIINRTLFSDPTFKGGLMLRSKPLTLKNVENRMKALELAKREGGIHVEELIDQLNRETGMSMTYDETKIDAETERKATVQQGIVDKALANQQEPLQQGKGTAKQNPTEPPAQKSEQATRNPVELIDLATHVVEASFEGNVAKLEALNAEIRTLTSSEFTAVKKMCYHNLLQNHADGNALALVFPEWAGVEDGEG